METEKQTEIQKETSEEAVNKAVDAAEKGHNSKNRILIFLSIVLLLAGAVTLVLLGRTLRNREQYEGEQWYGNVREADAAADTLSGLEAFALQNSAGDSSLADGWVYGNDMQIYCSGALLAMDEKYYYAANATDGGKLYRITRDGSFQREKLTEIPASMISLKEDRLYFVNSYDNGSDARGIYGVNTDGTQIEYLSDAVPADMILVNDWLYYLSANDWHIYKLNVRERREILLTDKNCDYMTIHENVIYFSYQEETDETEDISSKQEEVGELLAEREKQAEELQASVDGASGEGNMPTEEETDAGGEVFSEEGTDTEGEVFAEEEISAEEAAAAAEGSVPYTVEMAAIANASVGDIVYFGSYEQDNDTANGAEPVEWYVLDKADGEATLLSVYLLDGQPYHEEWEDITWENCTLRSWLNGEFSNAAFSAEEQAAIVNTNVVNEDNPYFNTEGGNNTADNVWLLSLGEMEKYFHINGDVYDVYLNGNMSWEEYVVYCYRQDNRVYAKPTAYAEARGVWAYSKEQAQSEMDEYGYDMSCVIGSCWWWLRSPGISSDRAADVCSGIYFVDNNLGVRPALKVAY